LSCGIKFTKNNSVIWFDLFKAFSFDLFLIKDFS
jgi:hypothetical protein